MWNYISIILIFIEVSLLIWFTFSRIRKKRINETIIFLFLVFIVDLTLNLTPFLYKAIALKTPVNYSLEIFDCLVNTANLFIGKADVENIADFANIHPAFTYAYALGTLMAMLATVSAAIDAFRSTIKNSFSLSKVMKSPVCDLVIGNNETALKYAKNKKAVLLLDSTTTKDSAVALMKDGYVVLCREFSAELLDSRIFNKSTRYNIICPKDENNNLRQLNEFVAYKKERNGKKNINLYLEVFSDQANTIHREIIEKNRLEYCINTFSTYELMARAFTENHPISRYLPDSFIAEDTSIKSHISINVFYLGFGELSQEIYRHSIINNQFVTFKNGEYRVFPVNYFIYDPDVDFDNWNIGGLMQELYDLKNCPEQYLPLPDMPFTAVTEKKPIYSRESLIKIKNKISEPDSYSFVIVDTDNQYRNIEIGARLQTMLSSAENYHIFIDSQTGYCENNSKVTYYGVKDDILTRNVIVNESLSVMAKKLNEVYTARYHRDSRSAEYIKAEAEKSWKNLDNFTVFSNIYTALNLRTKLNLLGLDYIPNGKSENINLINRYYPYTKESKAEGYDIRSVRNALLAQEHYRWNAYHLINEYLPLAKDEIRINSKKGEKIKFIVKNTSSKKHACLTTFKGLTTLSSYLAEKAEDFDGISHSNSEFDYIIYDEIPLASATEILSQLKFSVIDKH